jgi:SNF2 family DNA or RNA helicase
MGQTLPVSVYRFIIKDTIEERIQELQVKIEFQIYFLELLGKKNSCR